MAHEIDEELHREGHGIYHVQPAQDALPYEVTEEEIEVYLQRRNYLEHQIATLKAQLQEKLRPFVSELEQLNATHEHRVERYCREVYAESGTKTFAFWNGTCRLRHIPAHIEITNEAALVENCRNLKNWCLLNFSVKKAEAKEWAESVMLDKGELLPGCDLVQERESFSISFKKE